MLITGDLEPEEFKKLVAKKYSHIKMKQVNHHKWQTEPLYDSAKRLELEENQIKSSIYYKIYRVPSFFDGVAGVPVKKSDIYNLLVLSEILGGSNTSYLHERLVLNQDIANSISVDYSPISKAETTFDINLQIKDTVGIKKAEKALSFAINDFIQNFNDVKQIEMIKIKIKANQIYAKDDAMGYARGLGKFLSAGGNRRRV